jgi:hypothetical protein
MPTAREVLQTMLDALMQAPVRQRRGPRSPYLKNGKEAEWVFTQKVAATAITLGWKVHHNYDSRKSNRRNSNTPGCPDLIMCRQLPGYRPRLIFAELKTDVGKEKPEQKGWAVILRACGVEVYLWRPSDWPMIDKVLGRDEQCS